jgi:2,3-bisphosphoglycerate-dependent phosphoglycerate mutase
MASLTLVRHGQSTYNFENRFTGNLDVPLTELGRDEAHLAARKLSSFRFAAAYTSMLSRAWETLEIILREIHLSDIPVIKNAALNERMYGSLQGLNKAEVAAEYGLDQVETWRRSYVTQPPDGESLQDTYNRTVPYYKSVIEPLVKAGSNILIVAHGNSLRALMMYLENISPQDIAIVNIATAAPRVYTFNDEMLLVEALYL